MNMQPPGAPLSDQASRRHHPLRERRRGYQLWPRGIRGRLLFILAVGVLAAQGITGWLYGRYHRWEGTQFMVESFGNRVVAIANLLEAVPPERQAQLIQSLNNPLLHVQQLAQNPVDIRQYQTDPILDELRSQLSQTRDAPFAVQIRDFDVSTFKNHLRRKADSATLWPSHHQLIIALKNPTGEWWVFSTPLDFHSHRRGKFFWVWLIVTGGVVWLVVSLAARRVTAPILEFAAAAERLGMDVNAPPLPERGTKELRLAAQAFNQMQTRLQRLIHDRTFMLAAISHDLRTILTRLRLRTEFIADATQQQKAEADLAQMDAMLKSTLAFAKEDSTPEDRTQLDLVSLLQSICDECSDAGHLAQYRGPNRLSLLGQPIALRRAFTNLIENAVLYGQEVSVTVSQQDSEVTVAIADRGPGIPVPMQEKVFQPYFRLEPSRNRDTGGTGLGLAVARTVIQRHGGEITLSPREGGGLVAQVTIPIGHPLQTPPQ